jgi:hypothetical protein
MSSKVVVTGLSLFAPALLGPGSRIPPAETALQRLKSLVFLLVSALKISSQTQYSRAFLVGFRFQSEGPKPLDSSDAPSWLIRR